MTIKPNLQVAEDRDNENFTIYYDAASKQYGIRETREIIKDGVHVYIQKSMEMNKVQLRKLMDDASKFYGVHNNYEPKDTSHAD